MDRSDIDSFIKENSAKITPRIVIRIGRLVLPLFIFLMFNYQFNVISGFSNTFDPHTWIYIYYLSIAYIIAPVKNPLIDYAYLSMLMLIASLIGLVFPIWQWHLSIPSVYSTSMILGLVFMFSWTIFRAYINLRHIIKYQLFEKQQDILNLGYWNLARRVKQQPFKNPAWVITINCTVWLLYIFIIIMPFYLFGFSKSTLHNYFLNCGYFIFTYLFGTFFFFGLRITSLIYKTQKKLGRRIQIIYLATKVSVHVNKINSQYDQV